MREFDRRTANIEELVPPLIEGIASLRARVTSGLDVRIVPDCSVENLLKLSAETGKLVIAIETLGECPRLVIKDGGVVLYLDHHPSEEALQSAGISPDVKLNAACVLVYQLVQYGLNNIRGFKHRLFQNGEANAIVVFKSQGIDQDGIVALEALTDLEAHLNPDKRNRLAVASRVEGSLDILGGSISEKAIATTQSFVARLSTFFSKFNEARQSGCLATMTPDEQIKTAWHDVIRLKQWIHGEWLKPGKLDTRYEVLMTSPQGHAAIVHQIGADARLEWPKELKQFKFVYWMVGAMSAETNEALYRSPTEINTEGSLAIGTIPQNDKLFRVSVQLNPDLQDAAMGLYPLYQLLNRFENTWGGRKWVGGSPLSGTRFSGSELLEHGDAAAKMIPDHRKGQAA